jgi:hypothetical protein
MSTAHFGALCARLRVFACIAAILTAAVAPPAAAQGLLAPVAGISSEGAAPPGTVRHRLVRVDPADLAGHIAPAGQDRSAGRVAAAERLDGAVSIELFPDIRATFRRTEVGTVGDSGIAWSGIAAGNAANVAHFIVEGGQITGTVEISRRLFRIDPVAGSVHRVSEIDPTLLPHREDDFILVPSSPAEGKRSAAPVRSNVRVLVAYTTRARNQSANIVNEIKLAVQKTNTAYNNTNIPITLVLAGTMHTGTYSEGPDTATQWGVVLEQLSGFRGAVLAAVRQRRNQLAADLVALIRGNSTIICGYAWLPEVPGPSTAIYGFSQHSVGCLAAGIVFPHELGHNMGLNHDRKTYAAQGGGNPPPSKYNFGFINNAAGVVDIMAYTSSCTRPCGYIPWFSTSTKKYQGTVKMGIPQGTPGAADASRRLRETRAAIAAYR